MTQMSFDLAESLIAKRTLDADDVARRISEGYCWSRGYGPGAANGVSALPAESLLKLEQRELLENVATDLYHASVEERIDGHTRSVAFARRDPN